MSKRGGLSKTILIAFVALCLPLAGCSKASGKGGIDVSGGGKKSSASSWVGATSKGDKSWGKSFGSIGGKHGFTGGGGNRNAIKIPKIGGPAKKKNKG